MAYHEKGIAIIIAQIIQFRKEVLSIIIISDILPPLILRIPISLVRRRAIKEVSPNNPMQAIMIDIIEKNDTILRWSSSDL